MIVLEGLHEYRKPLEKITPMTDNFVDNYYFITANHIYSVNDQEYTYASNRYGLTKEKKRP